MQKTYIVENEETRESRADYDCYTPDEIAMVAVSSEEKGSSVENLFAPGSRRGWRAGVPGRQVIRVIFTQPASVRRIDLLFRETTKERTQEFVLSWAESNEGMRHEIVRQQWNFSPLGSSEERESFHVQLSNVVVLELLIVPDIAGGNALASVDQLVISR